MSRYIKILNTLKQEITCNLLTPSQMACRSIILERLKYPGLVNIYGNHGTGKTVVGWCLHNEGKAVYIPEPKRIHGINTIDNLLFIDNADHHRSEFRRLLDDLEKVPSRRVVIVSHDRIEDYIMGVHLSCNQDDLVTAMTNLRHLDFLATPQMEPDENLFKDLWEVLQSCTRSEHQC